MNFHFIWIGAVPKVELLEKIVNKAMYFNAIFKYEKNTFNLWTTNDLKNGIKNRLFGILTSTVKIDIKSIEESLFSDNQQLRGKANSQFQTINSKDLYKIFLTENHGALRTHAFATDLLKYLLLYKFNGIFVDAGLELNYRELGNVLTTQGNILTSSGTIYEPCNFIENYPKYDYGYVRRHHHLDIQILYSNESSDNAKNYFFNVLFNCNKYFENNFGKLFSSPLRDSRIYLSSSNKTPPKPTFWAGMQLTITATGAPYSKTEPPPEFPPEDRKNDNIYLFRTAFNKVKREFFLDFPSVSLKDQTNQSFANYRNRRTVHMEL